ncbi:MAG: hypothetical protein WCF04_00775 [Candidatus Nanopelagicales bacterium]
MPDPADGRTTRIELTERIREFDTPEMVARTRGMFADVFTGLTHDETRDLLALLRRWLAALTTPDPGEEQPSCPAARSRQRWPPMASSTFAGIVVNVALLAGVAWVIRPRSHPLEVAS